MIEPDNQPPKGALGIIFLIVLMDLFGFGVIIPLLPFYALKYQASPLQVTILFSVYSLCQFFAAPVLGLLSDRHGRRPVLILSQLGSVAGYVLLGVVTQLQWANVAMALWLVYASRIIDGLSGGNISTAQAYISDVTSQENRSKGMGLIGAAFGIGFAAGPAVGGLLGNREHHMGYPAFAAACFSLLAMGLTWWRLPESRRHQPAAAEMWLHPGRFAPVLRRPMLVQLLLISSLSMVAFVMMDSSIALYLAQRFAYTPRQVGGLFAYIGIIIAIVQGGLIGRLTRVSGDWFPCVFGTALVAVGLVCFVQSDFLPAWAMGAILGGLAINAVGRSLQQPTISSLVSKYSDPREQGVTFGFFQGLGSLARVVGPIVAGIVYERHVIGPFVTGACIITVAAAWLLLLWLAAPGLAPSRFRRHIEIWRYLGGNAWRGRRNGGLSLRETASEFEKLGAT